MVYSLAVQEHVKLTLQMAETADPKAIAVMLYSLQGHYWQQGISEALMNQVAKDYLRLLDGYPEVVWRAAYDVILRQRERRFFPKIGELEDVLKAASARKEWRLKKLAALTKTVPKQTA